MSSTQPTKKDTLARRGGMGASIVATVFAAICPACVPAYAAVFAAFGVGFLSEVRVMRPLMVFLLCVSVLAIAWDTRIHKSFLPLSVTIIGGVLVYMFRYYYFKPEWITIGVALLVFGVVANYYKRRYAGIHPTCPVI